MELEIVSFEQAKALKDLGFPQESGDRYCLCNGVYDSSDYPKYFSKGDLIYSCYCGFTVDEVAFAPALDLVSKWLRKEKDIFININHVSNGYSSWLKTISDNYNIGANLGYVDSYEKAMSNGIDKAIEVLLEAQEHEDILVPEEVINDIAESHIPVIQGSVLSRYDAVQVLKDGIKLGINYSKNKK